MSVVEASVARRTDEWVEIPVFMDDGEPSPSGHALKLRPGTSESRLQLELPGGATWEVELVGLERAARMVGERDQ